MAKRVFDISVSIFFLFILSPLLGFVTLWILWRMGAPVLFRQVRPGIRAEPFTMLKFRTMRDDHDADGNPLSDAERLTDLGRFLRRTSLDELPELWNVIKGDMSLVGPRPLLTEYVSRYSEKQARRHEIRPGITGWSQVNGRNSISWERRFDMDVWYVDNRSFFIDLKILALTAYNVVRQSGVSADGEATMYTFRGREE